MAADELAADEPEQGGEPGGDDDSPAPWHFKLLVAVLAVYLAWRAVQGVGWVAHHL